MEKEKTYKRMNLVIKNFNIGSFVDYLKDIKKLDKNIISFIKNIYFNFASQNNNYTYGLYEYKLKDNKMIYYYIFTYLKDLFYFLDDSNIEIDINDLIKYNVIFFE